VLEAVWVALTVGYAIGRAVVVGRVFGKHGVNAWVYGAIDVITSIPLGIATARAVGAAIDHCWIAFRRWTIVAGLAFIAPDVYLLLFARHVPVRVYIVLGVYLAITTAIALNSAWRKIRAGHHNKTDAAAPLEHV
jgi:hypothetical protein